MAEVKKDEYVKPDFEKYAFADVAARLVNNKENPSYAQGALNILSKNLDLGTDGREYFNYVTEKATEDAINIEYAKFQDRLSKAKVSDVYAWHKNSMGGASDGQKKLIDSEFAKFSNENWGKLMDKIQSLKLKASGRLPSGIVSKDDVEKAKKEYQKYAGFDEAYELVSNYHYENQRSKAVEASKPFAYGKLEEKLLQFNPPKPKE